MRSSPLLLLVAGFSFGCTSTPSFEKIYDATVEDYGREAGAGGLYQEVHDRQRKRCETVMELYREGAVQTAEDHLFAAATLATSDEFEHLVAAQELAEGAVELGDDRGFPIQAEATDKLLLKEGRAQRYGTQIVWEPATGKWRLYAVDPTTTDETRTAMGVPTLAELQARIDELNEGAAAEVLRGAQR